MRVLDVDGREVHSGTRRWCRLRSVVETDITAMLTGAPTFSFGFWVADARSRRKPDIGDREDVEHAPRAAGALRQGKFVGPAPSTSRSLSANSGSLESLNR